MSVQVIVFEHPFKVERRIFEANQGCIKEILKSCRELPEQFEYSVIKNDEPATLDDAALDGDTLIIRAIPTGSISPKKNVESAGEGKFLLGAAVFTAGILLAPFGGFGLLLMQYGGYLMLGGVATVFGAQFVPDAEVDSISGGGKTRPDIRGASNSANTNGKLPCIFGKHLLTPFYATTPFTEIEDSSTSKNDSGKRLYYNILFALGYAPLKISSIKIGDTIISSGGTTAAMGAETSITFDGPYAGISGTFSNGTLPSGFTYVKKEEQLRISLDGSNYKSATLTFTIDATAKTATAPTGTKLDVGEEDGGYGIQIGDCIHFTNFANSGNNGYFVVKNVQAGPGSATNNQLIFVASTTGLVNETKSVIWSGAPSNIIETPKKTTNIKVIISFPQGMAAYGKNGSEPYTRPLYIRAYYRRKGTQAWSLMPNFDQSSGLVNYFESDTTLRLESSQIVSEGQYEVRVAREAGVFTYSGYTLYDKVEWSILQCTTSEEVWDSSKSKTSFLHLKVLATTALSGNLDKISVVAESIYQESVTGADWTEDSSYLYSPASAFLWALTSNYNPRPLTGTDRTTYIDYNTIELWRDYCATAATGGGQLHTCNAVVTEATTLEDLLNNIASTGRAFFTMKDGKYSVVWDTANSTIIQHITPRNSWGFTGSKLFDETPNLLQVSFIDAMNDWTSDEREVFEVGGSVTDTPREAVSMWGITSPSEIMRNGRYMMAARKLRPETFTLNMDAEQLACTIGDRVQVSHDAMLVGGSWGRVKTVIVDGSDNILSFTVDEPCAMDALESYVVRVRNVSGMLYAAVNTVGGSTTTLTFTTPQAPGSVAIGDLYQFGEQNIESLPCIVTGIEMQEDLSAKLSLMIYDEDVYSADSVAPPAFDSKISKKPIFSPAAVSDEVVRQATEVPTSIVIPVIQATADDRVANTTPKYIGSYLDTLPSSGMNANDWALRYSETPANRGVYIYTFDESDPPVGSWGVIANPTTAQLMALWADLCTISNNALYVTTLGNISEYIGTSVNFIEVLGANIAFINQLFANSIKVNTGGAIRGGDRYDENGDDNNPSATGFWLGADGTLKGKNCSFEDGNFSGAVSSGGSLVVGDRYDEDGATIDATKNGIFFDGATGKGKMAGISFEGTQGGGVQWGGPTKVGTGLQILSGGIEKSALSALNGTDVAYINSGLDSLRLYRWNGSVFAQVGSSLSIPGIGFLALAALNSTDVGLIDEGSSSLRLYRWNGSVFSQVGSSLSIPGVVNPAITALNSTDVAFIDTTLASLRLYHWNGSVFAQVGSSLSIPGVVNPAITALNSTDVGLIDEGSSSLRLYRWNGSVFSQVGSSLSIPGIGQPAITALNSTDVAFIDENLDLLSLYRWNGSVFAQVGSAGKTGLLGGLPALTAMNGTDIAMTDTATDELRKYQFSFALSTPYSRSLTG